MIFTVVARAGNSASKIGHRINTGRATYAAVLKRRFADSIFAPTCLRHQRARYFNGWTTFDAAGRENANVAAFANKFFALNLLEEVRNLVLGIQCLKFSPIAPSAERLRISRHILDRLVDHLCEQRIIKPLLQHVSTKLHIFRRFGKADDFRSNIKEISKGFLFSRKRFRLSLGQLRASQFSFQRHLLLGLQCLTLGNFLLRQHVDHLRVLLDSTAKPRRLWCACLKCDHLVSHCRYLLSEAGVKTAVHVVCWCC